MKTPKIKDELDIFKGLKALSESAFPKNCRNCGRRFETSEQYLKETEKVGGSGMKASFDNDDKPILEVYRNCICGSTLMDFFSDRRDISEKGLKRRVIFQKILDFLTEKGIPAHAGREELLKFMRTGESKILARFGVKSKLV